MKRSRQSAGKNLGGASSTEDPAGCTAAAAGDEGKRPKVDESELTVTLSSHDKADSLTLSEDKLWCWGENNSGFCLARATHAVHSGKYFWECEIFDPATNKHKNDALDENGRRNSFEDSNNAAHVRLGWASDAAALNAPVGYDIFGFGYRDIGGSKVNKSVRTDNYGAEFGPGDVIGCHLSIDRHDPSKSEIRFFKNGVDQGTAFRGTSIQQGVLFPAVSLYRDAYVRVNFGPFFIYPFNYIPKTAAKGDNQSEETVVVDRVDNRYFAGTLPVSELQPMSMEQKKIHSEYISQRRNFYYSAEVASIALLGDQTN